MSNKTKPTPALLPKVRFPEFRGTEGWEMTPLGQCLDYQQPTPYLVKDDRYNPTFKTPVLTAGKTFILGYTNEEDGVFDEGLPVIIFDDFTTATQFVDFPFKAKSSAMKILQAKKGAEIKFMYEALQTVSFEVGAHERHWISTFAPMPVPVPKPAEQQKIAECLSSVDELIAAQARKVDALKTQKKGLMQQLFPRDGETQPPFRLPEFKKAGAWERKLFSDLCDVKHGYAFESAFFSNEGEYVLLTPGNFYEQGGYRDRGELQKYFTGEIPVDYVLAKGDLLIAMTEQAAGLLGSPILVPESGKFLHNQRLGLVISKPGIEWANDFFFYVFNTEGVRKAIHDTASGAKVRHTSPTKVCDVLISVPTTLPEQQRIASGLSSLDALITAETLKLEGLKTHKKGLMRQLFPSLEEEE